MRMKQIIGYVLAFAITLGLSGCASSALTNQESSKQARIIFEVPNSVDLEDVKKALQAAIVHRTTDIKEQENLPPEELPEKPGHPTQGKGFGGMMGALTAGNPSFAVLRLNTSSAYYTITGKTEYKQMFNSVISYFKGAIYPYKGGAKVYIYQFYKEGEKGLTGHLAKAAAEKMTGGETQLVYIAQVRDKFLELLPQAKIKSQSPSKLKKVVLKGLQKGI